MSRIAKFDLSGLRPLFAHCEIVREKNAGTYQRLADERGFDKARTWMIGNSPKSDINPALEAGLGAVFVPHARTWTLERAQNPRTHERLMVAGAFRDLSTLFLSP